MKLLAANIELFVWVALFTVMFICGLMIIVPLAVHQIKKAWTWLRLSPGDDAVEVSTHFRYIAMHNYVRRIPKLYVPKDIPCLRDNTRFFNRICNPRLSPNKANQIMMKGL